MDILKKNFLYVYSDMKISLHFLFDLLIYYVLLHNVLILLSYYMWYYTLITCHTDN